MASKMAQFFQQLALDAEMMQKFQASKESREALLVAAGFDAAERAMMVAGDLNAMHTRMLADHGIKYISWSTNNNNNSNSIGKFKRPDASAR